MADTTFSVDAHAPADIARKVAQLGATKANMSFAKTASLSVMAGMFVALGGMFYTTVTSDVKGGFGLTQLLGGLVFTLGLLAISVAGGELFTGNNLLVMAAAGRQITVRQVLRNWAIVWGFNFVGSLVVAYLLYWSQQWSAGGNLVGARALYVGASKAALPFGVAFFRGIFANLLVCVASWMGYAGRTVTDKFFGMILPVSAFVAAGFEHSIANMFFIPYAMLVKGQSAVAAMPGVPVEKLHYLDMGHLAQNLVASTLGNIVGGAVMVGLGYWAIYQWKEQRSATRAKAAA